MRTVLVHYHIFKNAGTSFNWALKKYFGERYAEYDTTDAEGVIRSEKMLQYLELQPHVQAVSSHQVCFPSPNSSTVRGVPTLFLRHPLGRVTSIYTFQRKQDPNVSMGARMANELDFSAFVEWSLETMPKTIANYQVCFCAGPEMRQAATQPGPADLEVAMRNVRDAGFVGLVERYDDSLTVAQDRLREYFPELELETNRLNTTSRPKTTDMVIESLTEELGEARTEELIERNRLDVELHAYAAGLLDEHLSSIRAKAPEQETEKPAEQAKP